MQTDALFNTDYNLNLHMQMILNPLFSNTAIYQHLPPGI